MRIIANIRYCVFIATGLSINKNSTKEMETIMNDIYKDIEKQIANPALVGENRLLYKWKIQTEMLKILQKEYLLTREFVKFLAHFFR